MAFEAKGIVDKIATISCQFPYKQITLFSGSMNQFFFNILIMFLKFSVILDESQKRIPVCKAIAPWINKDR